MGTATLLTGEDLLRMREDGRCYERVQGGLVEMAPPGMEHGRCSLRIGRLLDEFVEEHALGIVTIESGVYLERDPDMVGGPDVMVISRDRMDPETEVTGYFEAAPDLVAEVAPPGDTYAEVTANVDECVRAGVRLAWVADPTFRRVSVTPGGQILSQGDTLSGVEALPGFAVPVSRLFSQRSR